MWAGLASAKFSASGPPYGLNWCSVHRSCCGADGHFSNGAGIRSAPGTSTCSRSSAWAFSPHGFSVSSPSWHRTSSRMAFAIQRDMSASISKPRPLSLRLCSSAKSWSCARVKAPVRPFALSLILQPKPPASSGQTALKKKSPLSTWLLATNCGSAQATRCPLTV